MSIDKFKNVGIDPDTTLIQNIVASVGEIPVLYQQWSWDGNIGESVIFDKDDVTSMTDKDIQTLVEELPLFNKELDNNEVTVSRTPSGFIFANFNFIVDN